MSKKMSFNDGQLLIIAAALAMLIKQVGQGGTDDLDEDTRIAYEGSKLLLTKISKFLNAEDIFDLARGLPMPPERPQAH